MNLNIYIRILLVTISVGKFTIIPLIFYPYFMTHDKNLLYILQSISVTGVGISGLYDLVNAFKCKKSNNDEKNCADSCILSIIYSGPFISVCWVINIITNETVTDEEYSISVYIILSYFFSLIFLVFLTIIGICFVCIKPNQINNLNNIKINN
jgi:hypothetical protein